MAHRVTHRVYFDGTYATAADVLRACNNGKVWIVKSRDLGGAQAFLTDICTEDISGSRGHFERGRFVKHESIGSARFCDPSSATTEDIVSSIAHDNTIDDDEKLHILGRILRPCARMVCGTCNACHEATRIAEEYGIYDLNEVLRERNV